jgi:hypothetical protein
MTHKCTDAYALTNGHIQIKLRSAKPMNEGGAQEGINENNVPIY